MLFTPLPGHTSVTEVQSHRDRLPLASLSVRSALGPLRMEQYGSTATYNVESVLRKNIVDSEYFRDTCGKLSTWEEVVDQIYYDVKDVEPWMSGNARGASTAFCLLYRSVSIWPTALNSDPSFRLYSDSFRPKTAQCCSPV